MKNLKLLREEKGMSQLALGMKIGTHQQSIHKYEKGINEPDIQTLKQLASLFNTSVDYLIGNTEIRRKIEPTDKFDLNKNESEVINKYRSLNNTAQNAIMNMLDTLLDNSK